MTARSLFWFACVLVLPACAGDDGGGGGDDAPATSGSPPGDDGHDDDPLPMTTAPEPKADLGVDPPADCTFACDVRNECLGESHDDCVLACTSAHDGYAATSDGCVAAYETLLGCVASLSCDEVAEYQQGAGDYPCAEQELAVDGACTGGGPAPSVCDALCESTSTCTGGDVAACLTLCGEAITNAEGVGPACLDAQTAVFECVATLSCDEYDAWVGGEPDAPCQAEDESLSTDCEPS